MSDRKIVVGDYWVAGPRTPWGYCPVAVVSAPEAGHVNVAPGDGRVHRVPTDDLVVRYGSSVLWAVTGSGRLMMVLSAGRSRGFLVDAGRPIGVESLPADVLDFERGNLAGEHFRALVEIGDSAADAARDAVSAV